MLRASMAAEALRSSGLTASVSLRSSSVFMGRRLQSSRTCWSRRETRRRAPGPGVEFNAWVAPGFHDDRGRSTAPGRRGPVFPPPPAPPSSTNGSPRWLRDELRSADGKGCSAPGVAALVFPPSFSPSPTPPLR
jgi:hypothetical protein